MPRLQALHEEWQRTPPLAVMVAAYLGIKPKEEGAADELVERMMQMGV